MTIVDTATRYLDALVSHEADTVPLAADVRRIDNGKVVVEGADALRTIIRREPALATSSFRWLVDGDDAIVFYDLDADMGDDSPVPAYIGERFTVRDDEIAEIEVVYTAGPSPRPPRPERWTGADPANARVLGAAQAYVAALVSHRAGAVPLAADVWRVENGAVTADGRDALQRSLESEIMHTVQAITDERWFVAGDTAAVFYDLRARVSEHEDMIVRIAERFRAVDGELVEIEAIFAPKAP